ncbi:MAG: tRNA (adenine-N1)-methyltransferase [Chloroflexota bacterium]
MKSKIIENKTVLQFGDLVQLVGEKNISFIIFLSADQQFQSHHGILEHNEIVGIKWGSRVKTHTQKVFIVLQPALDDIIRNVPRKTQIMYPKDIGYVMVSMGIGPGTKVIEAGSGSGALSTAFAYAVGETGQVISYEIKKKNLTIAKNNLLRFGLDKRVKFIHQDIAEGFQEEDAQALFLDVSNPEDYIDKVRAALMPGGFFGSILPTANQVSALITALKKNSFSFIEVSEIMHRYYKPSATRFRPVDRMVAHTGYLIFARRITSIQESIPDNNEF